MSRVTVPAPPRVDPPDLPGRLGSGVLTPRADLLQVRVAGAEGAHASLSECVLEAGVDDRLDLTGATLVDVEVEGLRATTFSGRGARLRRVHVAGGRVGTLDLADAELDEVELRGIRIDYLSLATARAVDVVIADCRIGALDLPRARLERVALPGSTVDELDARELGAKDLDLRGASLLAVTDPGSLRGATITMQQAHELAPAFASALGIRLAD